ncbi:MAG: hypothetical protein V4736_10945 [Bdellovibrionota bacterium]
MAPKPPFLKFSRLEKPCYSFELQDEIFVYAERAGEVCLYKAKANHEALKSLVLDLQEGEPNWELKIIGNCHFTNIFEGYCVEAGIRVLKVIARPEEFHIIYQSHDRRLFLEKIVRRQAA